MENANQSQKENCYENQCENCKCKVPMILGAIIFSLLMLIFGIFLGKTYFAAKQSLSVVPTPVTVAPTTTEATSGAEMANWKTYKNEKFGFEMKYPNNLILENKGGKDSFGNDKLFNIVLASPDYKTQGNAMAVEAISGYKFSVEFENVACSDFSKGYGDLKITKKKVGIYDAQFANALVDSNRYDFVAINIDNKCLFFGGDSKLSLKQNWFWFDTFDQILSTFKFTENSDKSISTSDWKTYIGETAYSTDGSTKFSIQYPQTWAIKNNILFPLGDVNADIQNYAAPYIFLGRGGHGGSVGEIISKTFPAGTARYAWNTSGFAAFDKNNVSYIFEAYYYGKPSNLTIQEFQQIFDKMLSTFKYL